MPKWSDYIITGVKYSNGHISHVWISVDNGEEDMNPGQMVTKNRVISLIKQGYNVHTGKWNYHTLHWIIGAPVSYFKRDGEEYLRTHPDYTDTDNLENMLPLHFFGL